MHCGHKIFHVFISPVKAVIHELDDQSVNYILCTSDDHLEIGHRENVLGLYVLWTSRMEGSGVLFRTSRRKKCADFCGAPEPPMICSCVVTAGNRGAQQLRRRFCCHKISRICIFGTAQNIIPTTMFSNYSARPLA